MKNKFVELCLTMGIKCKCTHSTYEHCYCEDHFHYSCKLCKCKKYIPYATNIKQLIKDNNDNS